MLSRFGSLLGWLLLQLSSFLSRLSLRRPSLDLATAQAMKRLHELPVDILLDIALELPLPDLLSLKQVHAVCSSKHAAS